MPRTSKAAASSKKPMMITPAPKSVRLRGGGGYQPSRMPKEVEKDRVCQFVDVVADVKEENRLEQVWIDLEDFKSAVYGVANGKITDGREETLNNITEKKDLTYIWSQDGKKIGFVGYSDGDDNIVSQVMDRFYEKAGRRDG